MRHLRTITAILSIAAIAAGCAGSSPGASSGGNESQGAAASQGGGGGASQPAASVGGGGGGIGGSGTNGSIHFEITGDVTKSGDVHFLNNAGVSQFVEGGWVAQFFDESTPNRVITINSNPASNIVNYGDGEITVIGSEEVGCTFNYSKNDTGGLKGTIDCSAPVAINIASGAQIHVQFHATVDAHT